jgi:methylmalonyl-CoA mutase N-terminal domain/subunit
MRGTKAGESARERWQREVLEPSLKKVPERQDAFTTVSGRPIDGLYTRASVATRAPSVPGEFPYTRGVYPEGYRRKPWTIRQFAGFGTPEQTNARYKQLLSAAEPG